MIKVTEEDVSSGALTQETSYTYDIADHLIGVNQGNQTRAFKYDAEGHLLFERIPEMTATINDGTGTYWTTKYTYTAFGAVATKTDARGVIITYGYDNLNRLTSVSYNASGATGVDSTNNVAYNYDTSQTSDTNGLLLSVTMTGPMATYTETLNYDSSKRVSSRTWTRDFSFTTSYQYNTANQMTQMIYPATGRTLNVTHDSAGRVSSIADQYRTYANNFTFSPAGQLTGLSLGNVASETYGYDTNRMQLISQTATPNGGSANGLMNLHYSYDAAAGQMGAGSTAGNAGQLMAINNNSTINGTTESAAYTYDGLGRLVTSNQSSNGSSAQRRFAYDRWGNRTGMWDSTSGGNQLQSIALQQSNGAPTNQISSVTVGKSAQNYTYDANGNVTNDGVHVYTYDGENRLRTVDWGTSNQASYVYDYANRRIKKYTNAAITYYAWEGNQVIGEYDSTGATVYNYVYAGSRLIARMGSGLINWYLSDRLSERLVLDGSGNVTGRMAHLPFGEDFGESGTQEKHHFTSYESDSEGGTNYAVNRQYPQTVGRFMRVDPKVGSISNPQSLDRYSYVENDPIQLIDPLGLEDGFLPGLGSSSGWGLTWLFNWSGIFPANINPPPPPEVPTIPVFTGPFSQQPNGRPPGTPCLAVLPTDADKMLLVIVAMHEGTPPEELGVRQYRVGDRKGRATGDPITWDTLEQEMGDIMYVLQNWASVHNRGSIRGAIDDIAHDNDHTGADVIRDGQAIVTGAMSGDDGSLRCQQLKLAIDAANGGVSPNIPASATHWVGHFSYRRNIPPRAGHIRVAETEFW